MDQPIIRLLAEGQRFAKNSPLKTASPISTAQDIFETISHAIKQVKNGVRKVDIIHSPVGTQTYQKIIDNVRSLCEKKGWKIQVLWEITDGVGYEVFEIEWS
jgi:hypothetical protein